MSKYQWLNVLVILLVVLISTSCKEEITIKPPAKLRLDFPENSSVEWRSEAGYFSELSSHYQVSCLFDRNAKLAIGDIVAVRKNVLKGKGDELGKKLTDLGIPVAGRVLKMVKGGKVLIEIDLGEEEIEISTVKKSKFNMLLQRNDVSKISQFEPFDIVEKVDFNSLHGDLMLHHIRLSLSDSLSLLTKLVVSNVESHKFKSDRIEKTKILNQQDNKFGMFYEFEGEMATNFQFYVTDSVNHFIWGQVLMDFESFKKEGIPTDADTKARIMTYIRRDLDKFIEKLNWPK
jgi:hypothetical protein